MYRQQANRLFYYLPITLSALASTGICFKVFFTKYDTTEIANGALLMLTTLAVLSLTYSITIPGPPEAKALALQSGECFLHSVVMVVVAIVLKFGVLFCDFAKPEPGELDVQVISMVIASIFILIAGLLGHMGLWCLADSLIERRYHRP